jgi:hypothetical protein
VDQSKDTKLFDDKFISDNVLPEIERTGGATVLVSPYGAPMQLLRMDQFQPPTWIVSKGREFEQVTEYPVHLDKVTRAANNALLAAEPRNSWSAIGFWIQEIPDWETFLVVEPVEAFTVHQMAVTAAEERDQEAIYALHSGEVELIDNVIAAHAVRDAHAAWLQDAIGE